MLKLSLSPALLFVIVVTLGTCIFYASNSDLILNSTALAMMTILLLSYLLCEIIRLYLYDSRRILINPVFLCSFMTLGMYYGMNNILYFMPANVVSSVGIKAIITDSMVKLELLAIIASGGIWIGYWSQIALSLIDTPFFSNIKNKYFVQDASLRLKVFLSIMLISILSRLLQLHLGVYGYAAGYKAIMKAAAYTQYFNLLGSLGKLSVIIIAIEYYRDKSPPKIISMLFYFTIFNEVYLGGFVTGFKSAVMMPFILVLLCQYARTGRMSLVWLVAIALSISVAYPFVERFRAIRDSADDAFPSTSIVQITRIMFFPTDNEINGASYQAEDYSAPTYLKIMSRTSMLQIGSYGVEFYDQRNGEMPDGAPAVISDIILSPFYSWIPRFIWSGKTIQNIGIWYSQVVMKMAYSFSSTAMGIITYLYIGGTYWLTFAGFFLLGILQRTVREVFQPWLTCAGSLLSLALVGMVASVAELNFDSVIVLLVRVAPMVFLIQKIVYNHK